MDVPKFKIVYSSEVISFLNGLNDKAKAKIMYNINKCKYVIDKISPEEEKYLESKGIKM